MTGGGFPHSDTPGSTLGRQLPGAFRSHPRPSSATDTKASTVGPSQLGTTKRRSQFEKCPASPAGHHAQLGGLLKHVWEVAHIGRAIAASSGADRDVVVAGALLHDIGKIETYRWDGVFGYTDRGRLHGHVVLGSLMLDRRLREAPEPVCTEVEEMTLQHMILSHHGQLEFGAAVPPMTLEAEVLHYADNSSAKSASMSDALQDDENFTGDELMSSRSIWQLDRRRAWRGRSDWGGTGRLDG